MDLIAFARGVPAPDMLPVDDLRIAARTAYDRAPVDVLSYGTGAGWGPLRTRLAAQHQVDPTRVVVTTGSLHGFALLVEVLVRQAAAEGRQARVIVESPTYDRPLLVLQRLGVEIVAVPHRPEGGLDLDAFEAAAAGGADLAYLIPTYQNPSGATLDATERLRVLEIIDAHGVLLLEDDPYGQLHFDAPAPTSIFALAGSDERVAFSGSFSKTVAPGLRVGWVVLPEALAARVATLANDTYISASFLGQATVDAYLEAGRFEPNVDRARALLKQRRDVLEAALDAHLPDSTWTSPQGGYFAWVRLPDDLDASRIATAAIEQGVSFVAGAAFGAHLEPFVRIAFSSPPIEHIPIGVQRLATACNAVATPR